MCVNETIHENFGQFGAPQIQFSYPNHQQLAEVLDTELPDAMLHFVKLDHGALVPLYFLQEAGWRSLRLALIRWACFVTLKKDGKLRVLIKGLFYVVFANT